MEQEQEKNNKRISITGTGRCGTTFIMLILTHLKLRVGFSIDNIDKNITKTCNSGLEKFWTDGTYIVKDISIIKIPNQVVQTLKDHSLELEHVFIPIRNYEDSAKSRFSLGGGAGGLWPHGRAVDVKSQKEFFYEVMSEYLYAMTVHDIPTTFINFDKMVESPKYLYEKLQPVLLKDISFEEFEISYNFASEHQKSGKRQY